MNHNSLASSTSASVSYWVAASLALGVAVTNGFGRLAYALILPDMQADLAWNYTMAGLPNTWNAVGNIAGALASLAMLRKIEPRWVFSIGLLLTALSLLLTGWSRDIEWIGLFRFVAGMGSSAAFAAGGALVAKRFETVPSKSGTAISIYFGGGGLGIVLSSVSLPFFSAQLGPAFWQYSWRMLGALAVFCSIAPLMTAFSIRMPKRQSIKEKYSLASSWPILTGYSLFGGGYIVYLTFAFAWLRVNKVPVIQSSLIWAIIGLMIMLSPVIWRRAMTNWYPSRVLALCAFAACVAGAIPVFSSNYTLIVLSATIYGGSIFIAPSAMTSFTRKHFQSSSWASIMTIATVLFSIFQAISPVIAGTLSDRYGLEAGFVVGSILLLASSVMALYQKKLN